MSRIIPASKVQETLKEMFDLHKDENNTIHETDFYGILREVDFDVKRPLIGFNQWSMTSSLRSSALVLLNALLIVVTMQLLSGCSNASPTKFGLQENKELNAQLYRIDRGVFIMQFEIEGHTYLANHYDGGIIHSMSCPCLDTPCTKTE